MQKFIALYLAEPSHANARRLTNYARKHPMALCALNHLEAALLREAMHLVAEAA